jgi:hypothetical protein
MHKHGLVGAGWKFAFDRAKTRAGQCDYTHKVISLSEYYVSESYVPLADIRNTILHEIAHVLAGDAAGHGREWKKKALEIGCDGQTCNYTWRGAHKRFRIYCDCGHIDLKRHRVSKKYSRDNVCGKCRTMHVGENVEKLCCSTAKLMRADDTVQASTMARVEKSKFTVFKQVAEPLWLKEPLLRGGKPRDDALDESLFSIDAAVNCIRADVSLNFAARGPCKTLAILTTPCASVTGVGRCPCPGKVKSRTTHATSGYCCCIL